MYRIIGADGREYGPAGADQVRQWVKEGRANAQTRTKAGASVWWVALGSMAEFADLFPAAAPPPPPVDTGLQPWTPIGLRTDYHISIGHCIGRAWKLVMQNFWLLVGASFIGGIICAGGFIPYFGFLIGLVVAGPMIGGLYALYLKKIRGQPADLGDIFIGFGPKFGPLVAAYLLSLFLVMLGLILFVIPGIYLMIAWAFALPLIIDKGMDFWDAMELSRKMITKHWWKMFGLALVLMLLCLAGILVFLIGFVIAGAICQAAAAYAYEDIFSPRREPAVVIP